MPSIDVHTDIFTDVLMTFTFMLISAISWSLFFIWLFWESQSTMYRSEPNLYMMHTMYCCILGIICCNCRDNMATYLLSIATKDKWSVMMHTFLIKQYWCNFSSHVVTQGLTFYIDLVPLNTWWAIAQMQLGAILHWSVFHHTHNSCHPLPVIIQLQGQY